MESTPLNPTAPGTQPGQGQPSTIGLTVYKDRDEIMKIIPTSFRPTGSLLGVGADDVLGYMCEYKECEMVHVTCGEDLNEAHGALGSHIDSFFGKSGRGAACLQVCRFGGVILHKLFALTPLLAGDPRIESYRRGVGMSGNLLPYMTDIILVLFRDRVSQ